MIFWGGAIWFFLITPMLERSCNHTIKTPYLASAWNCHHDQIIHAQVKQTSAWAGIKVCSKFTDNQFKHRLWCHYSQKKYIFKAWWPSYMCNHISSLTGLAQMHPQAPLCAMQAHQSEWQCCAAEPCMAQAWMQSECCAHPPSSIALSVIVTRQSFKEA